MKIIVLSDFATTQFQAAEEQLQRAHAEQLRQHAVAVERVRVANQARDDAPSIAWRSGRYGAALLAYLRCLVTSPLATPPAPPAPAWSREMNVLATGQTGEREVQSALAELLNDDWTAVSGYKNPRGEVDLLLIGPPGIFALEVKAISGHVFCDGDTWWKDKYDRYGNLVETRLPIADQRGRSPSRQLNEPIDMLQAQLRRCSVDVRISRGVVLAHRSSQIGQVIDPTVHFVGTTRDLRDRIFADIAAQPCHDRLFVTRVVEAVLRDHDFHARSYRQRSDRLG